MDLPDFPDLTDTSEEDDDTGSLGFGSFASGVGVEIEIFQLKNILSWKV